MWAGAKYRVDTELLGQLARIAEVALVVAGVVFGTLWLHGKFSR